MPPSTQSGAGPRPVQRSASAPARRLGLGAPTSGNVSTNGPTTALPGPATQLPVASGTPASPNPSAPPTAPTSPADRPRASTHPASPTVGTATPTHTPIQRATTAAPRQRPLLGAPLSAPPPGAESLSGRTSHGSSSVAGPPTTVQRAATALQGQAPDRTAGPPVATRIHGTPAPAQAAVPHRAPAVPLRAPAAGAPVVQRATSINSAQSSGPAPAGAPGRGLTPARALAPAPTPAAPPVGPHRATPVAVPLRRLSSPGAGPAVQRAVAPSAPVGRAVPLLSAATSGSGTTPPVVTPRAVARPNALPAQPVVQRHPAATPRAPGSAPGSSVATTAAPAPIPVQRNRSGPPLPTSAKTTTAVSAVSAHATSSQGSSGSGSSSGTPATHDSGESRSESDPVAKGQFDPRSLTDFQLDELTHRLIGRITRLVRTELRLDRERIGKLRDPRR
ncbi:hypothetical protein AB0H18_36740 [Streptomyces sp. NPDC020766]|uniref:hypothetical protein n=1 Tax=Streptomyces sp. NPDC020766 TaxID=3155011 RepID=UPI00340C26A2